jgi:hypothetical protein
LNEGEQQALMTQVTHLIDMTETKIRRLGLPHVKIGLFDERTRQPIQNPQELIDMAEGKEPPEVRAYREQARADEAKASEYSERDGSGVE